jgi:DNA-binding transcriptional ArsR family regulator
MSGPLSVRVLSELSESPATRYELCAVLGISRNSSSWTLRDLRMSGLVLRKPFPAGKQTHGPVPFIFHISEQGRKALKENAPCS